MTADELRSLADQTDINGCHTAATYLRACADALDAGPVAWRYWNEKSKAWNETASAPVAAAMQEFGRAVEPLYPLAMPAQAQPLRLPEPMTADENRGNLLDGNGSAPAVIRPRHRSRNPAQSEGGE